ncbi:MAG: hypothetical protein JXO44_10670 [Clostridia bacterium]|nr:hypothetical protein [Clostridia bacterium]
MIQKNKRFIFALLALGIVVSSFSFGASESLIMKLYHMTYQGVAEETQVLIQDGELYVNLSTLHSLLGLKTTISGNNIEFSDSTTSGSMTLSQSGDLYDGALINGQRQGQGTLYLKDGGKYQGAWVNNLYEGQGTLVASDGAVYVGAFSKGFIHGDGKMYYPDGSYYNGHFEYGIREGFGTYYIDPDNKYTGYWENGLRNGKGKAYVNGSYKKGFWENNLLIRTLSESEFSF